MMSAAFTPGPWQAQRPHGDAVSAVLHQESWAGHTTTPVEVVGRTPKRLRVRLLADTVLPHGRRGKIGQEILVPEYAVTESRK